MTSVAFVVMLPPNDMCCIYSYGATIMTSVAVVVMSRHGGLKVLIGGLYPQWEPGHLDEGSSGAQAKGDAPAALI